MGWRNPKLSLRSSPSWWIYINPINQSINISSTLTSKPSIRFSNQSTLEHSIQFFKKKKKCRECREKTLKKRPSLAHQGTLKWLQSYTIRALAAVRILLAIHKTVVYNHHSNDIAIHIWDQQIYLLCYIFELV